MSEDKQQLYREFYRQMFLIRRVEESVLELFSQGKLMGTAHTYIGQESGAVGIINALDREKDIIFSNHRGHGHYLTYSRDIVGLFGEIMGRSIGCCSGIGGSQHTYFKNMYTNGIQGGIVPVATGTALAEKEKKSDAISVVFLGDGTFGEGVIYESFNMAALWEVPILYVLEDNQYAQTTPKHLQHAGNLAERLQPYGIKTTELKLYDLEDTANTVDVVDVYESACEIVNSIRSACQPQFLVLRTYRLVPHSKGDDTREKSEIKLYSDHDPLQKVRQILLNDGVDVEKLEQDIESEVTEAITQASQNEPLDFQQLLQQIPIRESVMSTTYLQSLNDTLHKLFENDDRVYLIGEDILDPYGGAFKVSRGLSSKYPNRVITTPISEAGITGIGAGWPCGDYARLWN